MGMLFEPGACRKRSQQAEKGQIEIDEREDRGIITKEQKFRFSGNKMYFDMQILFNF